MDKKSVWQKWARNLHRWKLDGAAAIFLQAVGPLSIVFAQGLLFVQPLISSNPEWSLLAETLEFPDQRALFRQILQEGNGND